ncbi:hypothetical protein N7510_001853 [Penicillium lagena]|uniref:uncharacterized protein n=1 Tax=Penicillium lagena TaxID=94218 RepID=UPI0025412813|nr:uncharacterized protein N7510_001853 [Penicillium lagena]KAJ5625544.1 hypothetical protein N7510_001853 [Penicillium lagena]
MGKFVMLKEKPVHGRRQQRRLFVQIACLLALVWVCYRTLIGLGGLGSSSQENRAAEDHHLTESLSRIVKLLPDETETYKLLRPVRTTGEERLKEFGLRTRQYKELFEAWETLHIDNAPDTEFIRDDVIQRIQRNPQIASSLSMGHAELIQYYESYRSTITRLATLLFPWTAPYFSDHLQLRHQLSQGGRGLVFTAGNSHAPYLLTSIPVLRQLGCHLPIEVMYLGDDDLQPKYRTQLEAHAGVVTRDLRRMVNDAGWELRGWAGKPFSVLLSSFREVIFIDADSLFLQNPASLFDDPAYNETGALFFKDRLILPESKKDWLTRILPPPVSKNVRDSRLWTGESGHMQESGVLVIDTYRHFVPLLLVTRMNGPDRDGDSARGVRGVYDMLFGDKETFWLGWELSGVTDYAFHDGGAGTMGVAQSEPAASKSDTYTVCAPQLLHLDRTGRPLWFNGWLLPNKFSSKEPGKFESFIREEEGYVTDDSPWQLHPSNVCCLTSNKVFDFSENEKHVLDMTIESGRRTGALGEKSTSS